MPSLLVISHPEVVVDPATPVTEWGLSAEGRRRARAFAGSDTFANVSHIHASTERKARDTAKLLAAPKGLPVGYDARLGENDRAATGFLPPPVFEAAADAFFAHPNVSYRGWERAVDAQDRIKTVLRDVLARHEGADLALVTHGAVGTLLWCRLSGAPIDRRFDQPGQGHYWRADLATLTPAHGWRSIG
jgi:broad specificity phosphatase PhoE